MHNCTVSPPQIANNGCQYFDAIYFLEINDLGFLSFSLLFHLVSSMIGLNGSNQSVQINLLLWVEIIAFIDTDIN